MKLNILPLFLLLSFISFSQNKSIGVGEKLVYTASYNMSGLMTDLAQVTMETSEVKTSTSTLLRLKCKARTYSKWDNYFKIDDLYESYVSRTSLKPYLFKREINEGGYYKFMQYKYDHKANSVKSTMRKRRRDGSIWTKKNDLKIEDSTLDLVTTIYHIRNLDIDKASIGSNDTFTILIDNKETEIKLSLLGKETIKTEIGRKECYKLSISLDNNNMLKGDNSNLLWLTADKNKIPVYAKFKIPVGNGELKIQSATGLKH